MHRVESYVAGAWHRPPAEGQPLLDAATGQTVAELSPGGIDSPPPSSMGAPSAARRCGS